MGIKLLSLPCDVYKGHAHLPPLESLFSSYVACGGGVQVSPHEAHVGRDAMAHQRVHNFARHSRLRAVHLEHIGFNLKA